MRTCNIILVTTFIKKNFYNMISSISTIHQINCFCGNAYISDRPSVDDIAEMKDGYLQIFECRCRHDMMMNKQTQYIHIRTHTRTHACTHDTYIQTHNIHIQQTHKTHTHTYAHTHACTHARTHTHTRIMMMWEYLIPKLWRRTCHFWDVFSQSIPETCNSNSCNSIVNATSTNDILAHVADRLRFSQSCPELLLGA